MATKSDRILSYLPGTFKRQPQKSALQAIVDAFGQELLKGENSLAAIMQAHWVDHADRGSEVIKDLALIAALYGLAPRCDTPPDPPLLCALPPRCDETVEEFREHLKRYVRTFLDGTVTVQGILRIAAENLGVRIADEYDEIDAWWTRSNDPLITWRTLGDDASNRLFGLAEATAAGRDDTRATIHGTADLSGGVDLSATPILRLQVDDAPAVEIDFLEGRSDPVVPLNWITTLINNAVGSDQVAHDRQGFLTLTSIASGNDGRLTVLGGPQDASPALLGIVGRRATGSDDTAAAVTGLVDLSGGVDLSTDHFIRLVIDGDAAFEINLPSQPAVTLDQLVTEINDAIGETVAAHDDRFLTLTSTSAGFASSLNLEPPAAQDATRRLFGNIDLFHLGQDARAARFRGLSDLSSGVDLSQRANIALALDGDPAVTVNCAGSDPAQTAIGEITTAINDAVGQSVALHNGRVITISSPTIGPAGTVELDIAAQDDASDLILGLTPRSATGADGTAAHIAGTALHVEPINLLTQHTLKIGVDGQPPVEIDLHAGPADRTAVSLAEVAQAINDQVGMTIAHPGGQTLSLTSPTIGADSQLALIAQKERLNRRFVTRAHLTDEAAGTVLGFLMREATGTDGAAAQVTGQKDLSRSVDLRETRYLRLAVDEGDFVDIDCAGARPQATTIDEVVANINTALGSEVAAHDSKFLLLTSLMADATSRIAFAAPQATDALASLMGIAPTSAVGTNASGVRLVSTVDLSGGIDLAAGAALRLGVDEAAPLTVELTETDRTMSLNLIVNTINVKLGVALATTDGSRLILQTPSTGADSRLVIEAPAAGDVTALLLGFAPPRTYHGRAAAPARIDGQVVIDQPLDLTTRRFLDLGLDGGAVTTVDCTATAVDPAAVPLSTIVGAINTRLGGTIATEEGGRLVLSSLTAGSAGRIAVAAHLAGDARQRLFGDVPDETLGKDALPAVLTGEIDLIDGVDLSERANLRLEIDQLGPIDLNIGGPNPAATALVDMVDAINKAVPGLAAATDDDRLQLTSPTAGGGSRLAVRPLRFLELIEYPPGESKLFELQASHAQQWSIINRGAADTTAEITLISERGVAGPALLNRTSNVQLRLMTSFAPGDVIRLTADQNGDLRALVRSVNDDTPRSIPSNQLIVGRCDTAAHQQPFLKAADILKLPRGRSDWHFLDCPVARFDAAYFDSDYYANGICLEPAVFDVSCFAGDGPVQAVFAAENLAPTTETTVRFTWSEYQPAAFNVNLPVDLHPRFGARFDQSRFGLTPGNPELYAAVVASPADDPTHLVTQVAARDRALIEAAVVASVPQGWEPFAMPFRQPRFLTLGRADQKARLYLSETGLDGFIEIRAQEPGAWGNELAVSVRPAGPAIYDVCIVFEGGRFENARQAVAGQAAPPLAQEMVQAGPVGVLQAKAAGVLATITRERVD